MQPDARWKDHDAKGKQAAVLFDLVAKDNERARFIARHVDNQSLEDAVRVASESAPPFAQLNEFLALGTLTVSLENSQGEEILARHGNDGARFSIAKMSDGERSAAIMAATVLTVEPGTVLLIDEPERHLHRAIIEPFLSALFKQREDCVFVVSTHEIALPIANPEARVLMVRSCTWNGDMGRAWDVELLDPNAELPEELRRDILGARRRILFVEGTTNSNSLDLPLYDALFPKLSVLTKGSCSDVQRAVSGLRAAQDLHHVEAFGLIDKDDRPTDEIENLAENGVFALDVCSVEALYYCSAAITAVARRQAESLGTNGDELIELTNTKALDVLKQGGLAERMAARRCERQVRNSMLSQLPTWKQIKANTSFTITHVDSSYPDELNRFQELVVARELDGLLTRYPLRDSCVFNAIAKALKCQIRRDYERMVVSQIRRDDELSRKLKERIAPLSAALEAGKASAPAEVHPIAR